MAALADRGERGDLEFLRCVAIAGDGVLLRFIFFEFRRQPWAFGSVKKICFAAKNDQPTDQITKSGYVFLGKSCMERLDFLVRSTMSILELKNYIYTIFFCECLSLSYRSKLIAALNLSNCYSLLFTSHWITTKTGGAARNFW